MMVLLMLLILIMMKEIITAFEKILTLANDYYKQNQYFDYKLWLKQ